MPEYQLSTMIVLIKAAVCNEAAHLKVAQIEVA